MPRLHKPGRAIPRALLCKSDNAGNERGERMCRLKRFGGIKLSDGSIPICEVCGGERADASIEITTDFDVYLHEDCIPILEKLIQKAILENRLIVGVKRGLSNG